MADVAALAADILARLQPHAVPGRAEAERRYLKSTRRHLGVPVPALRAVARAVLREHPDLDDRTRLELAGALWDTGTYELCRVAVLLLEDAADRLDAGAGDPVEDLVRDARTWALVDPLAIGVIGTIGVHDDRIWLRVERWISDDDRWVRRAALLAHLPALRADHAVFDAFAVHADALLDDRQVVVRKAIGWVLREVARRDPAVVTAWLAPRVRQASGVTFREAVRHLPAADRERLLAARGR